MESIAERVARVKWRVEDAAKRSGREPASVRLVAVSKTFPPAAVAEGARAGLTEFGENRVQEAAAKRPSVARILGARPVAWHLVGHLQSNKAKAAAPLFDLIHSVDDADLAGKLDRAAKALGKRQEILVQVNVSGEDTKSGVAPGGLRALVETVAVLDGLDLRGLMTIPPYEAEPDRARPHFARLRALGAAVRGWIGPRAYGDELSMGMTDDFEAAIEEGATIVRIGRAIFGERGAGLLAIDRGGD